MTHIDPYEDPNEATCVICGGHRIACSHPPVCSDDCRFWWEFEIEAHRFYQESLKKETT